MTFSQYTVIYLEHPETTERMNLGVAAWDMLLKDNAERVPAEPEKLVWYFYRRWQRLEEIAGYHAPDQWRNFCADMELSWTLTRLLNELHQAVGPYTMLRFTEPRSSTTDAVTTMMSVARFVLPKGSWS